MKKFTCSLLAATILRALFACTLTAAESPSVLLQKGIYAEETEGNLDSAIKIYEQIAAEAATNRGIAAQAQYRLAVCYQKKGNKEQAVTLLQELLQRLPSDADASKRARETLVQLGAAPSVGVTVRKLPLPVGWVWAVSRDGKFIAYEPPVESNLCIYETETGKSWVAYKGTDDTGPWDVVFSPDDKRIAYSVRGMRIWVANIDGSAPKILYEDKHATKDGDGKGQSGRTWFGGWSTATGQILVNSWDEGSAFELNPDTGSTKEYARLGPPDQGDWLPSSDGEWAARVKKDYPRSITLLNLKSNREETVIGRDAKNLYGWIANDSKLIYSKLRAGGVDLWAITVKDGKVFGAPEMVWSNLGDVAIGGTTNDGTIYYFTKEKYPTPKNLWVMEGLFTRTVPPAANSIAPEIPSEEILAPSNSILDRKFGLGATIPTGWTIRAATRRNGDTGSILTLGIPDAPRAFLRIAYQATTPWEVPSPGFPLKEMGPKPTTTAEIDSWLGRWQRAHTQGHLDSPNPNYADYKTRPDSIVPRSINGNRALSWAADFKRAGENWTELETMVYSEIGYVVAWVQIPTSNRDVVSPGFEQLVTSVQFTPPKN